MPQTVHHIEWHELDKRKYYVIGPSLFMGVRLLVYPPLLIKTRIQVQKRTAVYGGTFDAVKKIWKYEGIRGYYRGFLVSSFGIFSGQVYITTYELSRSALSGYDNFIRGSVAGVIASLAGQTITVPIDVISQRLMVQGSGCTENFKDSQACSGHQDNKSGVTSHSKGQVRSYTTSKALCVDNIQKKATETGRAASEIPRGKLAVDRVVRKQKLKGSFTIIREILKKDGIFGFYRGYVASILTYAPNSGIWWGSYGMFTNLVGNLLPDDTPHMVVRGIAGPLAGIVAACCTNPVDVIRTRLQVEGGPSMIAVAKKLYNEEGIRALHKGLSARIASTLPTSFLIIIGYETVKRLSLKDEYRDKLGS